MEIKKTGNHKYELQFVTYRGKEYLVRLDFHTLSGGLFNEMVNVKVFDKETYKKTILGEVGLVYNDNYECSSEKRIMEQTLPEFMSRVFVQCQKHIDVYEQKRNNSIIQVMNDWDGKIK